jgi:hypothetical protein
MADENECRRAAEDVLVQMDTVRAVVNAYAEGQIELPVPATDMPGRLRYAPHFGVVPGRLPGGAATGTERGARGGRG